MFILTLYGDPSLPRHIVQLIIQYMDDFLRSVFLPSLKSDIIQILNKNKVSDNCLCDVEKCFSKHRSVFENVSTEAKRFRLLRSKGYVDPEHFKIAETFVEKIVGNEIVYVPENVCAVHVSLQKNLKLFLQFQECFSKH